MLRIGDFAGITGLSVKALRHYGEKGILVPEEVDERSGYRLYSERQVRRGVMVRALRSAGVPLRELASVEGPSAALEVLDAHRRIVLQERATEDRAYDDAGRELRSLLVPVTVEERWMLQQHYVGRVLSASAEEADDLTDEQANDGFSALHRRLNEAGVPMTGAFWTALRTGESGDVEVVGCWEIDEDPAGRWSGEGDVTGTLPARRDLVATWRPTDADEVPHGATHPAIVALFDAIDERGADLPVRTTEVRQAVRGGFGSDDFAVEVAVTLEHG